MNMVKKASAASVGEGMEFVLSDETVDRYGDIIEARGWDVRNFTKNPIALFGHSGDFPIGKWENIRVDGKRLVGRLKMAAEGTSQRIDELRRLIEQGILSAVSVGFRPIDHEPLEGGGRRYKKQELLETSLVSVPANPAALAIAKSLHISDDTLALAFGETAIRDAQGVVEKSGKTADKPPHAKRKSGMKLSERIVAMQDELVSAKDALTGLQGDDDLDVDAIDEANSQIETLEIKLAALKRSEQNLAAKSADATEKPAAPALRKPLGVKVKEPSKGDLLIRAAAANAIAYWTNKGVDQVLDERYKDHEATHIVTKAAVAGATTTTSGWAAELVQEAVADFMETLRPMSVYPQVAAAGTKLSFGPNSGSIKIPSRASTPSITGSFVAEGAPIPVRRLGLTSITLSPHKMGVISVFSREIAKYSNPAIESLIRSEILSDTAITLDTLLFDTTAGSTTRPKGLLNGLTSITEDTTGGYVSILADLEALAAPFDTANAGRNLLLLMNPKQARKIRFSPGPDGTFGWSSDLMTEFTPIVSTTIPADTVIMMDAADFVSATGDVPEFDFSEQAVLHMEDTTPAQIGTTGTPTVVAAPTQSMFQTAQTAMRMLLDVTWAMRRTGMVTFAAAVEW